MTTSQKVADIFLAAGEAFQNLGNLTMELHPNPDAQPNSKWSAAEMENLRTAVKSFGDDLNAIASRMKMRTVSQVKQKIKDEMLSTASSSAAKHSAAASSDEPAAKKTKTSLGEASTSAAKINLSGLEAASDVESVTIHDSELHADEEGQLSSDSDGSDVDV